MEHFASTPDGLLLAANGIDPVIAWDGNTAEMEEAGLAAPLTALTITGDTLGEISGTYYAYSRFLDRDGNPSDLSPLSDEVILSEIANVNYSGVPVPSSPKVKTRQILRNTAGQTAVFYVDVETDDLTSTTFTSTREDSDLQVQEPVALFDSLGMPLANTHGVPPSDKSVIEAHMDRMFAAGEEVYKDGSVKVTLGSKTVSGIGTQWPATLAGRFLWVAGAGKSYEIDSVDVANQTLTLLEPYETVSLEYASYGIRPPIAQRRLVQFTQPGEPQSWPASNAVSVQEDGDEIVGLMPMGSFVYIIERRHIYRMTFQEDPLQDGFIFLSCNRGSLNSRCHAVVDESAYLMDEAGVYKFSGANDAEHLSAPIQDLFEPARPGQRYRVRHEGRKYFHCVYDYGAGLIRWFVCLTGTRYPRHAIVLNIRSGAFWVEEYPVPVASSCNVLIDGDRRVALGGPDGTTYVLNQGSLDVVDARRGVVRGTATSSTPLSLTDTASAFGDDVVGAPVVMVTGEGRWQMRKVVERPSSNTVRIDRPWSVAPDAGDTYQIGGVRWRYRTGWFRWAPADSENERRLEILFEPTADAQTLQAFLYQDRSKAPVVWDADYYPEDLNQMGSERDDAALTGNLQGALGFMQRRLSGHKVFYVDGPRLFSWELVGITNTEEAVIYQITLDGAVPRS
jgi:hypothetical protein